MKKLLIILLILVSFLFARPTEAQSSKAQLRVSPVLLNIILSPGKLYTYDVTIENLSDQPVPLRATLDSLNTDDDSELSFTNTKPSPLVEWTTITPSEILVPANGKETITVSVQIPNKVALGGYYAFLFLDPVLTPQQSTSVVTARIGLPLLANIGVFENSKQTQIETFSFSKMIYETPDIATKIRIKNMSLYHYSVKPVLFVKPIFGNEREFPYEEKILFPGKGRRWEVTSKIPDLWPGFYKTELRVSTGKGNLISESGYFILFPYIKVFATILITSLIVFIWRKKRQFAKAIKILLGRSE